MAASAVLTVLLLGTTNAQLPLSDYRPWTTDKGRTSDVRLRLVDRSETSVKLQREDNGKVVTLAISTLSDKDQAFLNDLRKTPAVRMQDQAEASSQNEVSPERSQVDSSPGIGTMQDWPGWRGAGRDGINRSTGLLKQWPDSGPTLLWTVDGLGEGYSSPSVVGDQLFVLGTAGQRERLIAFDVSDGRQQWHAEMGTKAGGGGYPGPRSTPTIDQDRAYAIGSDGTLVCVDISNGQVRWSKHLQRDYGGRCGHWSYAESPLVVDNRLIFTPGGNRSTVAAVNKLTGTALWTGSAASLSNGDDSDNAYTTAAYSSPIFAQVAAVGQTIHFLRGGLVSFAVDDGKPLWHYDAPANDTANCPTPVFWEDAVFAASGYGQGGGKAKITRRGRVWNVNEEFFVSKFVNHHGGFILHDGFLYGTNESALLCVDWSSGAIRWQNRCVGKGSVSLADGMLYVRSERGPVALVAASPEQYQLAGQFVQPQRSDKQAWPYPVIAGGKLYLRDWDRLFCYDLREN